MTDDSCHIFFSAEVDQHGNVWQAVVRKRLKIWSCRRTEALFHSNSAEGSTDCTKSCNSYSHNSSELVLWWYLLALEFRFLKDIHLVSSRFLTLTQNFLGRKKINLDGIISLSSRKIKDLICLVLPLCKKKMSKLLPDRLVSQDCCLF